MRLPSVISKKAAVALMFATACSLAAPAADAAGIMTIRQADGSTDLYRNVAIKVIHDALFMTSADGKGTLIIHRAACSYQGELLVCFATSATLIQGGKTSSIDLLNGTIYANSTGDPQPMALSTTKIPPHSLVLSFSTKRGTYVNLSGRIDKVVQ
jgi:hypothetical protein